MAAHQDAPTARGDSPSPNTSPSRTLRSRSELARCVSMASTMSPGSATTDRSSARESLGSDASAFYLTPSSSNVSTGSQLKNRHSVGSFDSSRSSSGGEKRRGYMRPLGTDFAASARSRESVLSLGSIAHLQYYFARTGLLDGKGGQLARKKKGRTLDLSALDTNFYLTARAATNSDHDSGYAGSSPDHATSSGLLSSEGLLESPIDEFDEYSDYEDPDPDVLPPTVSTYRHREKPLPKPPSVAELRQDLIDALNVASESLNKAVEKKAEPQSVTDVAAVSKPNRPGSSSWHEIQGVHILDVMTLAVRAAKLYYTEHENPDRLDAIKSEKALRSELLSVMDVLRRMATRSFAGGMRDDEIGTMHAWISSLRDMLAAEANLEAAELQKCLSWEWIRPDGWDTNTFAREEAFLHTMLEGFSDPVPGMTPLPTWTPIDRTNPAVVVPTAFLAALSNGIRLVQLHNCAVRRSRRRFGAIPTYHSDTQKPYRAVDNLRYWAKAAELRWEIVLRFDPLALQYSGKGLKVWTDFEDAVAAWCRRLRDEFAADVHRLTEVTDKTQ